jgi:hypothetical protein
MSRKSIQSLFELFAAGVTLVQLVRHPKAAQNMIRHANYQMSSHMNRFHLKDYGDLMRWEDDGGSLFRPEP